MPHVMLPKPHTPYVPHIQILRVIRRVSADEANTLADQERDSDPPGLVDTTSYHHEGEDVDSQEAEGKIAG